MIDNAEDPYEIYFNHKRHGLTREEIALYDMGRKNEKVNAVEMAYTESIKSMRNAVMGIY
jgi:hypothetical protein